MATRPGTVEKLVDPKFWRGRRVFITGHTGFKGGWLALWLQSMGASVSGYALAPTDTPNLFETARVAEGMRSTIADIRDLGSLTRVLHDAQAEVVFHLAAQALVSEGYRSPVETYGANVMGTVHLLEAARQQPGLRAVVIVTSDKCYDNRERQRGYREDEALGGADPYSSSKACAELVSAAYRRSFFSSPESAHIATARAGNVIGGGDWAENRLIPDLLRAFSRGASAQLRRPESVRPWQHVLEPLAGYMILAESLCNSKKSATAWNFGPGEDDCLPVHAVAKLLAEHWAPDAACEHQQQNFPHEATLLRLDASLARELLGWHPRWPLDQALKATAEWHRAWLDGQSMREFTLAQINSYMAQS